MRLGLTFCLFALGWALGRGYWIFALIVVIFVAIIIYLFNKKSSFFKKSKNPVEPNNEPETKSFLKTQSASANPESTGKPGPALREDRKKALRDVEEQIDILLSDGLTLLKQTLDKTFTLAVFFPSRDGGVYLRSWISESESLIGGATLQSNQGLAGKLLKDDITRVLEGDIITDSTQLHYYAANEGINSLAGVPILVQGSRRGAILVDSLEKQAFDNHTIENLEEFARLIGHLVYYAYLSCENAHQRDQLIALSQYQRKFLENMSLDNILLHVREYMTQSVEGERFMVIARQEENSQAGKVISCEGVGTKFFQDLYFDFSEKGLISLVFEKEQIINRSFQGFEYTPRFGSKEKPDPQWSCLMAVPVHTDQGVDMALMVESSRLKRYSEYQQAMLLTIARAMGFALSRARLYQEKEHLASRDGLTGVQNRRVFNEQFQKEILRAQRQDVQVAVLMMDIDHFKKVNDTYGHAAGDLVLKEVAGILSQAVRAGSDTLARFGGEEFVCLLTETTPSRAMETAERIRHSVAQKSFDTGNGIPFQVTISIGGAIFPDDSRHGKELLEKADKALYKAKESGRNRAIFYNG